LAANPGLEGCKPLRGLRVNASKGHTIFHHNGTPRQARGGRKTNPQMTQMNADF